MNDLYIRWDSGSALIKSDLFFPMKQRGIKFFEYMLEENYYAYPEDHMIEAVLLFLSSEVLKEENAKRKKALDKNLSTLLKWAEERFDITYESN